MPPVARCDDALGRQPVQAGAYRPLRQPGIADQRGHGNAPVPSGPAWLARPTSTNLHALDGWPPWPAGTWARFTPRRSPRRSRGVAPQTCCSAEGRPAPCLSFCLIHPRPGPFTSDRPSHVQAGHGRWRTSVNAGQHCWKACWGQPLASSNVASSAALSCGNAITQRPETVSTSRLVSVLSHFLATERPDLEPTAMRPPRSATVLCLVTGIPDPPERSRKAYASPSSGRARPGPRQGAPETVGHGLPGLMRPDS